MNEIKNDNINQNTEELPGPAEKPSKSYNLPKTIRTAFVASIPVMAGYIVTGLGFGILLATQGYGPLWAAAIVLIIYAGSMQFVCLELMASGASLVTSAIMTLMVQVRHLFYSISMVGPYKDAGKYKTYLGYALTDETYALVCQLDLPEDVDTTKYCFYLSLMDQFYWFFGCVTGDIIGISVNYDFAGIDFAMTAMFVAIATEQWVKSKNHWSALSGLIISVGCLIIFGSDSFLIPTMILIIVALTVERKLGLIPSLAEIEAEEQAEKRATETPDESTAEVSCAEPAEAGGDGNGN